MQTKPVIRRKDETAKHVEIVGKNKGFLPFEELEIWKSSRELVKFVYTVTAMSKDRGFRDQLQRACISVMNNIAEGRESGSAKSFRRYLSIAKASCGEVRSMFYVAMDVGLLSNERSVRGIDQATRLTKMIAGFSKTLK